MAKDILAERFALANTGAGARSPYYPMVPKGLVDNLAFRRALIEYCRENEPAQQDVWRMCSRDMLFWINTFCWGYDPRSSADFPVVPFITYPFQDTTLMTLEDAIGVEDVTIPKSRAMGVTFMCLLVLLHQFQFKEYRTFLCVSQKEDFVDKKGDPDSLFWKLDFEIEHQPSWLRPQIDRNSLSIRNPEMHTTIDGSATIENVGRGGRRTATLLDEFSSVPNGYAMDSATGANTNCRFFVSTPKGTNNAFADRVKKETGKIIRLHWTQHPIYSKGLYNGPDGKPRSPWYDLQCQRAPHPQSIAQEYDIDFLGSAFAWFEAAQLDACEKNDVKPPFYVGELDYVLPACKPHGFTPNAKGRWQLWTYIDGEGKPPGDRQYVVGVDISQGTGASNSVISVVDRKTRTKIGEFAWPRIRAEELGELVVATCRLFRGTDGDGAYLIWEANGPGEPFGRKVMELGYRNFYYRHDERKLTRAVTDVPGWWSSVSSKMQLFSEYRAALGKSFINPSKMAIGECRELVFVPDGGVEHAGTSNMVDPSGAGANHADRATADALACKACGERPALEMRVDKIAPVSSMAYRRMEREAKLKAATRY